MVERSAGAERRGKTHTAFWDPSLLSSIADDGVECVLCQLASNHHSKRNGEDERAHDGGCLEPSDPLSILGCR